MEEVFMQEHIGDNGPGPGGQVPEVSRYGEQQEEIRILDMPVQQEIENFYQVDDNKYGQVNINQPGQDGTRFERSFYLINDGHGLIKIAVLIARISKSSAGWYSSILSG
jgi:hypothetical protein